MPRKRTHKEFVYQLDLVQPDLTVVDEYVNTDTKICVIDNDGVRYMSYPWQLLQGYKPNVLSAIDKNKWFKKRLDEKRPGLTMITDYINSSSKIVVEDKGGVQYAVGAHGLLMEGGFDAKCIINKNHWFKMRAKLAHGSRYCYDLVEYESSQKKIKIICKKHGIFEQSPSNHLHGHGCDSCARDEVRESRGNLFSRTAWIKNCNERGGTPSVYVVEMFNDNERFIKIGITYKSVDSRFLKEKLPYKYRLLYLHVDSAEYVFNKERELHKRFKEYRYKPLKHFGGMTECFNMFVLGEIKKLDLFKIAV